MPLPTVDSSGDALKARFDRVIVAMHNARAVSVTSKAQLAAGDTAIKDIIDDIYVPFVREAARGGFWKVMTDLAAGKHFRRYYREQLSQRIKFEAGDENLATDRITVDGNKFDVDDPVEIVGTGTPPTGLTVKTDYFVFDKNAGGGAVSFKVGLGGTKINITAAGSGENYVQLRVGADFTTLIDALEAVIDEIIVEVPVTTTTLELRSVKFDKALASNLDGLEEAVLTSTQTATLQTKLQAVIDAIEAPV